ncbi:glycosyltransferase family 2 protein [Christiangramia flava]|uniref:Glycosyl transferase, family 2 n=1 Tax=Christiangramia flava JLT2011 TaxID=1229726 RepID=A0A1L7I6C8_9FLAO|nr:glycosyltransferase family 2 protein [Christiangramia flava]APU68662.1 Glycosyl transferase, family 2 [Christiangramia flava JLT2011]OSS38186.1 Glycosyl transferase, family 2 [Christiangramia flava JLT2011]
MRSSISVIILTFNEEKHLKRCIKSLKGIADEIIVVDSYSSDNTVQIAKDMGAKVYQNSWVNYATQFNWALKNCEISSEWVWRIDADEYIEPLGFSISNYLAKLSPEITGLYIKRKVVFLEKPLMYGGWYPVWHLKIWRHGSGKCEARWMDEHIILDSGKTERIDIVQVDENLNDLTWWTAKHNSYATREMIDLLDTKYEIFSKNELKPNFFGTTEQKKRWLKLRYLNLPLFLRPFVYFIYRYFFKLGFLDGKQGFVWHLLQGFWYRFLVDAKIFELNLKFKNDRKAIIDFIKTTYNI